MKALVIGSVQFCTKPYQGHSTTPQHSELFMAESPLTISVPDAGKKYFGLSRNASYAAAARGDIPTIRIGKLLRVPVRALDQMLEHPNAVRGEGT
jgi:hypothetical protein